MQRAPDRGFRCPIPFPGVFPDRPVVFARSKKTVYSCCSLTEACSMEQLHTGTEAFVAQEEKQYGFRK